MKTTFLTSAVVPAARGSVKVNKDRNNNYLIKIKVLHLAETKRLTPPRNMYVVWLMTDKNTPQNLGMIKSSSTFWSKILRASFEGVSSNKPARIFITAEDDAKIHSPGSQVVLSTAAL